MFIHASSHQISLTTFPGLAAGANQAAALDATEILKDDSMKAVFLQFRMFLEFQEHREQLSKCSCGALKDDNKDASIAPQANKNLHKSGSEQTESPNQADRLQAEIGKEHSELQYTQVVEKSHSASRSFQHPHAKNLTKLSPWSWNDQSIFFSTYAPSWHWWLDRLQSISLFSYLFWGPMVLCVVLLLVYPRTLLMLIWTFTKYATKSVFMWLFHPDEHHHESELEAEEEDSAVKELGIVKPPNTIWEVSWDKLTDGQRTVMDLMGVQDEKVWIERCALHGGSGTGALRADSEEHASRRLAMRDWEELDLKQRRGMSSLGFTRESWHFMPDGMSIQEKMWSDLSDLEMRAIKQFEDVNADSWDNRSAAIFRTPWYQLSIEHAQALRKLGFNARRWKPYKDPKYRKSSLSCGGLASCVYRIIESPQDMLQTLLLAWASAWVILVLWRLHIIQMLVGQIGMYVFLFMGILACVMVAFTELFQIVHEVHDDVVVKMRKVHLYMTSFWETASSVPHDVTVLIDDVRKVITALKNVNCKHCNSCQLCLPKPCKNCQNCAPSCLPWKS